ncbi:response regulator transcription factor [Duganella aceris]|uniref:Response regulator transcription factor n=1 Tax=Duganella aceris TaxID=2703883 RepID=A0ABX0FRQ2_9BURK|nr:response regulator transcription factor [Duganella aceris]NGZ87321.1 response regulator transcription factor [Duganella aceris]
MAECLASPIRVLIADDHPLMREGLAAVFACNPGLALVAEAANGREAVELYKQHRPDVVLMDLQMPVMSGTEAITAILEFHRQARIVALTTYGGDAHVARALRLGAVSYLLKNTARAELFNCLATVHGGGRHMAVEVALQLAAHHHPGDALSAREIEVLGLIANGNSNRRAALLLGVTEDTIKGHMKSILSKLSANDRTHAVMIAINRGILGV